MNITVEGTLYSIIGNQISYKDRYFDFNLEKTTNLFITLSNLKRDLDLYVTYLDSSGNPPTLPNGTVLNYASSTNDRAEDESIFLQLKPGSYRAEIRENYGANYWAEKSNVEDYSFTLQLDGTTFDETTTLSNDPYLSYQWHLFNTGLLNSELIDDTKNLNNFPVATPNVDIRAPEAWNLRTDGTGIVLAIIDGGVDLEHPDLKDNLWRNEGEIPGNGKDDDKNDFKDDIHGWNFYDKNATPKKAKHGTHVAGIAAASGNNGIGISGVAWNAKIMSLDVFPSDDDDDGRAKTEDIINAIYYAVNNGAKVINMSLGSNMKKPPLAALQEVNDYKEAFAYARKHDVFIAIAAGNEGGPMSDKTLWNNVGDLDTYATSPAFYSREFSNIATVISTDSNNKKTAYSNYGQSATIAAPGGDTAKIIDMYVPGPGEPGEQESVEVNFGILSTVPVGTGDERFEGNYDFFQGTSMASPVIAGMATLIRSADASITAQDTLAILRAGATVEPGLLGSVNRGLTANLENSLRIAENWTGPSDLLKLQQSEETPVINMSFLDQGALGITGTTTVTGKAGFDPITGFYKAVDAFGSVYDSLGNLLRPGDSNYAEVALNKTNIVSDISNISIGNTQSFEITESTFLAPFGKFNGNTYFAFEEANSDNFAHFKPLGDNKLGFEISKGGGDQDFIDRIISFNVESLV